MHIRRNHCYNGCTDSLLFTYFHTIIRKSGHLADKINRENQPIYSKVN